MSKYRPWKLLPPRRRHNYYDDGWTGRPTRPDGQRQPEAPQYRRHTRAFLALLSPLLVRRGARRIDDHRQHLGTGDGAGIDRPGGRLLSVPERQRMLVYNDRTQRDD